MEEAIKQQDASDDAQDNQVNFLKTLQLQFSNVRMLYLVFKNVRVEGFQLTLPFAVVSKHTFPGQVRTWSIIATDQESHSSF